MPALSPLVTATDMEDYGYDPAPDGVLARASARVRRHTRQQITAGTSTVSLSGCGPWLLPQRPVTAVTEVLDADGATVGHTRHGSWLHLDGRLSPPQPLSVTFEHGYETLPDELVELVCAIADRMAGMPSSVGAGVRTEQAGGESVTWGADAYSSASDLTRSEKKALDAWFGRRARTTHLTAAPPGLNPA